MYLKRLGKESKNFIYKILIILFFPFSFCFYFILSNFIFSETTVRADEMGTCSCSCRLDCVDVINCVSPGEEYSLVSSSFDAYGDTTVCKYCRVVCK